MAVLSSQLDSPSMVITVTATTVRATAAISSIPPPPPQLADPYLSAQPEHHFQGVVHRRKLSRGQPASLVSETLGIHRCGLLDQDPGRGSIDLDLGSEAGRSCARGGRRHEPGGERKEVGLDDDGVPAALLFKPAAVLRGSEAIEITTH